MATQVAKAIKKLDIKEKIKAVALNYHLEKKKELDDEYEKELKTLNRKYEELSLPIYKDSQDIITGIRAPNDGELEKLSTFLDDNDKNLEELK